MTRWMALAALLCALSDTARAEDAPRRVVAPAPMLEGELRARWQAELGDRMRAGLQRGGFDVVSAPADCTQGTCLTEAARAANAQLVTHGTVSATGRDYEIRIQLVDAQSGDEIVVVSDACDTCGFAELAETVENLAATAKKAVDATAPLPATLVVRSTPPNATLTVDGVAMGTTPAELSLDAGAHEIVLEHPGRTPHRRRLRLAAGEVSTVEAELDEVPPPKSDAPRRDDRRQKVLVGAGAPMLAVGLAGLASGVALLALHGRPLRGECSGDDVDAQGDCRFLHDTQTGGIALTAVGGALVVGGVVTLALLAKRRDRDPSTVRVRPRGLGLEMAF